MKLINLGKFIKIFRFLFLFLLPNCFNDEKLNNTGLYDQIFFETEYIKTDSLLLNENFDLNGVWIQKLVLTRKTQIPFVGENYEKTTSLSLVEIEHKETEIKMKSKICDLYTENEKNLVQVIFPEKFIKSIPIYYKSAYIQEINNNNFLLFQPKFYEIYGVELTEPENEPLPQSPSNPKVIDQDNDGKPGMTIFITGIINGELYIIQRMWTILKGDIISEEYIKGIVEWEDERIVLGSDNDLLFNNLPISYKDPNVNNHFFIMKKIKDNIDCEKLKDISPQIF